MSWDFTPSPRAHGAQRMLCATVLICEAFVVFFAVLVAYGLYPDNRGFSVGIGMVIALALGLVPGLFRREVAWPYVLGLALQLPVLAYGVIIPAMAVIGAGFAVLYWLSLVKGGRADREKDAVDRAVLEGREEAPGSAR